MKYLIFILLPFITIDANSQVIGNKQIESKENALKDLYKINVQMYAKVYIDMDAPPGITIIAESNLIALIQQNIQKGELILDQKQWIEPTQDIVIRIGAPQLRELEMGTHDKVIVANISGNIFKVNAEIGEVILDGGVDELNIESKMGRVDASKLMSKSAVVRIKSDGEVIINTSSMVDCDIDEDAIFRNINPYASLNKCSNRISEKKVDYETNRFINLKIKNNSWQRNHFVVVGPKPDGRKFSYGFPLMPLQSKKERWTVGTKVYKENSIGIRTLLVTLTEADENKTVELFK